MNLKINRYNTTNKKRRKIADAVYLSSVLLFLAFIGGFMLVFPRSVKSVLEQRTLEEFPEFSLETFRDGSYTADIGIYFSDTVPFRDSLTVLSSEIRDLTGFRLNNIKLHNVTLAERDEELPENGVLDEPPAGGAEKNDDLPAEERSNRSERSFTPIPAAETEPIPSDDSVNITNNGIAVVGTRALMLYGGNYTVGEQYADVINRYKSELGGSVNVYSMVIPTSVEFYCPVSVKPLTGDQLGNINNIYSRLAGVTGVDVYTPLSTHTGEPIYLRTDHHWSSLGAYYAAKEFAAAAGVPFAELSEYDEYSIDGYVGTMYSYTQDITIKNNPENFVYYVPKNTEISTTYYNYILGENNEIIGMQPPIDSSFYLDFSKDKSMLYCTFMGGDAKITHVHTSTGNGRRLAIFKDSYGNALPQFLFGSFEDIYVFDMRYFTYNAIDYIKEKGITDLLFANNAFHAVTKSTVRYYENYLVRGKEEETAQTAATAAEEVTQTSSVTAPPAVSEETAPPSTAVTADYLIPETVQTVSEVQVSAAADEQVQ